MTRIDLDELTSELRRQLASLPDGDDIKKGMYRGLLATGQARLIAEAGDTVHRHGGYLSGHLLRWLVERDLVDLERFVDRAFQYMYTGYAVCLADEGGQRLLAKPDKPVTAHGYAVMCSESKLNGPDGGGR